MLNNHLDTKGDIYNRIMAYNADIGTDLVILPDDEYDRRQVKEMILADIADGYEYDKAKETRRNRRRSMKTDKEKRIARLEIKPYINDSPGIRKNLKKAATRERRHKGYYSREISISDMRFYGKNGYKGSALCDFTV